MTKRELEARLRESGVEDYAFEASVLAEAFCGVKSAEYVFFDKDLGSDELLRAVARRESGEPLQYIVGKWPFMNEVYDVDPSVLIPRQDTETLVEWAIANVPKGGVIIDLCTGSGCIAISTLAARGDLRAHAVDISQGAVSVARRNAEQNGIAERIEFFVGDVLAGFLSDEKYDVILSNPPYVSLDEYGALERELYFEPKWALTDGGDGLTFYRAIAEKYRNSIKDGGAIAFEIGASQADAVCKIAAECGMTSEIIKDLSGNDRVAVLRKERTGAV